VFVSVDKRPGSQATAIMGTASGDTYLDCRSMRKELCITGWSGGRIEVGGCEERNVCLGALMGPHVVQDQETTWLLQSVGLDLLGEPLPWRHTCASR